MTETNTKFTSNATGTLSRGDTFSQLVNQLPRDLAMIVPILGGCNPFKIMWPVIFFVRVAVMYLVLLGGPWPHESQSHQLMYAKSLDFQGSSAKAPYKQVDSYIAATLSPRNTQLTCSNTSHTPNRGNLISTSPIPNWNGLPYFLLVAHRWDNLSRWEDYVINC